MHSYCIVRDVVTGHIRGCGHGHGGGHGHGYDYGHGRRIWRYVGGVMVMVMIMVMVVVMVMVIVNDIAIVAYGQ